MREFLELLKPQSSGEWVCVIILIVFVLYDAYEFFFFNRVQERRYQRTARDVNWNRNH